MAGADFIRELRALGYVVDDSPLPRAAGSIVVRFGYRVPVGSAAGQEIVLALIVPPDYPMTCPSGPYMSPHVLPVNTLTTEPPYGGVHDASGTFGPGWQYWSRPFQGWATSERTVRAYLRHIAHLFDLI